MSTLPIVKNAITTSQISGHCIGTIPAGTNFKVTVYDEDQTICLCHGLNGISLIAKHEFKIIDENS